MDGHTHTQRFPVGFTPPVGCSHEPECFLSSCAQFFMSTPSFAPHADLTGGCFADEETEPEGALAAACPRRRPRPASPLLRAADPGDVISALQARPPSVPGSDLPPDWEPLEGRHRVMIQPAQHRAYVSE